MKLKSWVFVLLGVAAVMDGLSVSQANLLHHSLGRSRDAALAGSLNLKSYFSLQTEMYLDLGVYAAIGLTLSLIALILLLFVKPASRHA